MALRVYRRDARHAVASGQVATGQGRLPLLLGRATQRRRLVADIGAVGRSVLLMVMVVLLVMLVRCWTWASRAGWGSKAGRAQGECDAHGAKQD